MIVIGDYRGINNVDSMPTTEENNIISYLQGSVYTWCNNHPNEWFNARNFAADENKDWSNTPLIYLYTRRINSGMSEEDARRQAKFDLGNILKSVVHNDVRFYETKSINGLRNYRWLPNYIPQ